MQLICEVHLYKFRATEEPFFNQTRVICCKRFSDENAANYVWRKGNYRVYDHFQPKWGNGL